MVRWMAMLAAGTALASCTASPPPDVAAPVVPAEMPAPAPVPKPTYGSYGFDTAGMDSSILPGDSFFDYANGTWAKNTQIPADKASYGMFDVLDDLSKERTRAIIAEAAKDSSNRVGQVYNSFLDTAAIDAKGLAPIQPWLGQVRGLNSRSGLASLYAKADRMGISTPFSFYINQDDKTPDRYIAVLAQSGLGLPDRDYYLSADPKLAAIRTKYVAHLANMLTLAGEANAAARAKAVFDLEASIAKVHWTQVESRDAVKTYNLMPLTKLAASMRGYDIASMLTGLGIKASEVNVNQPSAIIGTASIVGKAPLGVLRDQLIVRSLRAFASNLPSTVDNENFAFYGTALSGIPQQQPRWKRAVSFTSQTLADDVSKTYAERYFPAETKAAADELVKNVVAAMGRRIDGLTWMQPATKARAHAKLAHFTTKIGYPDQWHDYSTLAIQPGDALGNAMRAAEWRHVDEVSKLGTPIRRWEWGMTPMTINAYANFSMSEIVFPAAILQPPFFDPNADPALNYGGIGAVIGHEISHHFDDQGAKYDEYGRLADWWTPADVKAFEAATGQLVAQYDRYEPLPGMHVKGALTLGENIGDLAGLTVAYDAYRNSLGGTAAPVIDGTTGDQRFYLGWAQVWRCNMREPMLRQQLITDPHSPCRQRTSVVRNLDPWYAAFDAKPGQTLYLTPEQRVRMW